MEIIYERCCGLDIHKKSITACVIVGRKKEIKTFGTMTGRLAANDSVPQRAQGSNDGNGEYGVALETDLQYHGSGGDIGDTC